MTKILAIIGAMLCASVPLVTLANPAFSVGPASVSIALPAEGNSTALIYVTSDFDGELTVGLEGLPFRVEPETIPVAIGDTNKPVELTFYANKSIEAGMYSGIVTFLTYAGDNVAYGVKIKANVTYAGTPGENPQSDEDKGDLLLDAIADNYVIVILGMLVAVALAIGILIGGRKER